jgi:hypothetical protein
MNLDYSTLSDEELEAIANNDYSKLSDATLQAIAQQPPAKEPAAPTTPTESPFTTFAAKAVNAIGFGLPEYLEKTFQPERAAQSQQIISANPQAARYGEMFGDVAALAIPAGAGLYKGAQLGGQAINALARRVAPEMATGSVGQLASLYGRAQGAATGGVMGAQLGAAVPGIIQGKPEQSVAAASLVNQYANMIPGTSPLGGVTGNIVPAVVGGAGELARSGNLSQMVPYMSPLGQVTDMGTRALKSGYDRLDAMIRAAAAKKALMGQ